MDLHVLDEINTAIANTLFGSPSDAKMKVGSKLYQDTMINSTMMALIHKLLRVCLDSHKMLASKCDQRRVGTRKFVLQQMHVCGHLGIKENVLVI